MRKIKATLMLEDGSEFTGYSFGYIGNSAGEAVFNTSMNGYPESLTDPSYRGQILVATYPLIGNYGVPDNRTEDQLPLFLESENIHISGLVVTEYSERYSHWNASKSLSDWLTEHQVPGISGLDTRMLTKKIRERGSLLAKIIVEGDIDWIDSNKDNLVGQVSVKQNITYGGDKGLRIVLIDCGVKSNIIRCLLKRNVSVIRVPYDYDFTADEFDGLFISNGPGDPKMNAKTIHHLQKAMQLDKPIMGICLGTQLLALAAGADTYKLLYGHRSHNQPVILKGTDRCFITTQNHGYAVNAKTLPPEWEVMFENANDGTCEGIKHKTKPIFAAQFHPEAFGGPNDTEFLFDEFLKLITNTRNS
ncbi:MAG: glutamine-hydrolyzing carbamoyl-phosphate synthase small subunit [Bacteroidales bacterium]|nr:glutamine-hydrolyzing carbamoyl-phosphate synthase small subunit [Bacteroidales bacterium]